MRLITTLTLSLALVLGLSACSEKKPVSLVDLQGQWVVVNYWAEWCKPCIKEIPELNALNDQHSDITVVGVNFDGIVGDALAEQERRLGVRFQTLSYDPSSELGIERPKALPTTVILKPSGERLDVLIGPQTEASLVALIRAQP
jgi:thiol-disulfide isomerase/thioredoxin